MNDTVTFQMVSSSPAHTAQCAAEVAEVVRGGDVVLLRGGLGAGKTTFCRALGQALRCTGEVTSPTFVLVAEHECDRGDITTFVHCDLYRVGSVEEAEMLALDELIEPHTLCVVEWPDNGPSWLQHGAIAMSFDITGDHERMIALTVPDVSARRLEMSHLWTTVGDRT